MFVHAPTARARSAVKAITWRFFGSLDTAILTFFASHWVFHAGWAQSAGVMASFFGIESVSKIILFYFHERAWAHITWGRADKDLPHDEHGAHEEPAGPH
jgi:uncharacterized membrane protein